MTKLALEAVWKGMKGDFEGAALLSDEMRKNQKEYNEELLNTAKDLFGIEREQESINSNYVKQADAIDDVTDSLNAQADTMSQSIEDAYAYAAALRRGYVPRTIDEASPVTGGSSSTQSSGGTGTANIISAPSDFVQGQGMGGVKPHDWSGGATINIGTVNESSAGAVAKSIDRLYRKATVLGPQ